MSGYQLQLTGGKAFPTEVAKASNGMPFGLPERGAPELLALLTFIAGFTLLSDAIVGVAFGGTIFYWTCVGALAGYAGVLLGFLIGLPMVFFCPTATCPMASYLKRPGEREGRDAPILPDGPDSFFLLNGSPPIKKCGQVLTLVYLSMDACLAGGVMGAALAGGLGLGLELYYAPTEGEFYAERDIHHIMPIFNYGLFFLVFARNLFKTLRGWVPRLVDEMQEWRPKEPLDALF